MLVPPAFVRNVVVGAVGLSADWVAPASVYDQEGATAPGDEHSEGSRG